MKIMQKMIILIENNIIRLFHFSKNKYIEINLFQTIKKISKNYLRKRHQKWWKIKKLKALQFSIISKISLVYKDMKWINKKKKRNRNLIERNHYVIIYKMNR
jgi:hypothetical protein